MFEYAIGVLKDQINSNRTYFTKGTLTESNEELEQVIKLLEREEK